MAWVRIEDDFPNHPKIVGLSDAAFRLHVSAICFSNHYLNDGLIPEKTAQQIIGARWKSIAQELVSARVWSTTRGGYVIHDYHRYQPTRDEVLVRRADRQRAGRMGGQASARARAQAGGQPRTQSRTQVSKETCTHEEGDERVLRVLKDTKPGRLA